jgi:tetratricopeptide (TPR) repeat protein
MKALFLIAGFFCLSSFFAQAQYDDQIKIAEARTAIEKHNDFESGLKALKEVSVIAQNDPLFIYYFALANEKLYNYEEAVSFYKKYLNIFPGKSEILEKISELNYIIRKKSDLTGDWFSDNDMINIEQRGDSIIVKLVFVSDEWKSKYWNYDDTVFVGKRLKDEISGLYYHIAIDYEKKCEDPKNGTRKVASRATGKINRKDGKEITVSSEFWKFKKDPAGDCSPFKQPGMYQGALWKKTEKK